MGVFGLKLTGTRLLNYANLNTDNTLVGRFLGASSLGIYGISYNIMFTPLSRINLPIYGVVAPALARLQHDPERLKAAWLRSKRLTATLLNPAFFAILVVAPDLVRVILPAKWLPAVPVIRLLCLAGLGHSLIALNSTILQARGHAGTVLRLGIFTSVVTLTAFASGLPWGILGVAGFFAAAKWLLVLPDTWITTRRAEVPLHSALWASGAMLPFGLASAAAGYGLQQLLVNAGAPAVVRLVVAGAAVFVIYAGLIYAFVPSFVREVRGVLSRRRAGAEAPPDAPLPADADAASFLAFASTPEGYRFIDCEGSAPSPEAEVEVPGYQRPFVVERVGTSPLPLDRRSCAFVAPRFRRGR